MRDFSLQTLGVSLGLFLRRIRSYFQPKSPWEKIDSYPPNVIAPTATQFEEVLAPVEPQRVTDEPGKGLWVDCSYCWIVLCKNHWFHRRRNLFNVHRIPLGQTDAVSPRPTIAEPFRAHCDECGRGYIFKPSEVLRWEMDVPASFVPHPMFRE